MKIKRYISTTTVAALALLFLNSGCEYSNLDDVDRLPTATVTAPPAQQPSSPQNPSPAPTPSPSQPSAPPVRGGSGIGPNGGGGGFLWKPVSESNRKLVVLLPARYTRQVSGVFISTSAGRPIERGSYTGVHNGGREHYRFSKPGSGYGGNVYVVADLKAGGSVHWVVPNGAARTTF
ncbi:MAG TPA: hypothetical protein PKE26_09595 [Kiritimatiellia bacterium]|nr:hypothetical protein [Kiritimatiellia bacterium]HMP97443.1 hypothetical protein [Kiritimatiellia bacterium]